MKRQSKPKKPNYHGAEVYEHVNRHRKYPQGERIPHQLWYLAVALASMMTAFVAILLHG